MILNKINLIKSILALFVGILIFSSCTSYSGKKGNVKVHLHLQNASGLTAIVQILKSKEVINVDTIQLDDNGEIKFYLNPDEISFFSILFENEKKEIRLLAEEGDEIEVNGDLNDLLNTLHFNGNPKLEQLNEFHKIVLEYTLVLDSLREAYSVLMEKNMHYAHDEQFNEKYRKSTVNMNKKVVDFVKKHQNQFIVLLALRSLNPKEYLDLYRQTAKVMQQTLPQSSYVNYFVNEVSKLSNMSIGGEIPNFSLPNPEGELVNLNKYKGKYVLLDIWATWCKPCKAEMPYLAKAKEQFKDKDFEVISICVDRAEVKNAWLKTIEDLNTKWVHVFDLNGEGIVDLYGIQMFPTLILIDPQGKIVDSSSSPNSNFRREEMLKRLNEIFL
jgi:thiol-disulfide isomerase/thioredoxin